MDGEQPRQYSDGGIFRNSEMIQTITHPPAGQLPDTTVKLPIVFVTDKAFPLLINFMRPYPKKDLKLMPCSTIGTPELGEL